MPVSTLLHDCALVGRAVLTNQVARHAPALYVRLTGQTGRGSAPESPAVTAAYFIRCVDEYLQQLGIAGSDAPAFLAGRRVLEYGPGDVLGVALVLYARGVASVQCVDRFPLSRGGAARVAVYEALLRQLPAAERTRADAAFVRAGDASSGLRPEVIGYSVTQDGLAPSGATYDLVLSRAVLEHVHDLPALFADLRRVLRPGAVSIHQVDLKSHGLDRRREYDFLTWPDWLYGLMYSEKGFPNRHRVDRYRALALAAGLRLVRLEPTGRVDAARIEALRPQLPERFRELSTDELSWLGFWMVVEPPA